MATKNKELLMVELGPKFEGDRIVIYLDPGQPIALGDLSESFAALARMYERHYHKNGNVTPRLYITKLETGSILMEIAPFLPLFGQVVQSMDTTVVVSDFTNRLWRGIKSFSSGPEDIPKVDPPTGDDARDIREFVKPLLGKKNAALGIKHARYEKTDGDRKTVVEYSFEEAELNRAAINIDMLIASPLSADEVDVEEPREQIKREVMLFMDQANRGPGKQRGRTGDRGIIPDVSEKALPVYFRKSFENLKSQMTRDVNPLTSMFVVDVHVQYIDGEPKGYVVTEVHQVTPAEEG
jgi:hypothetical protein